MKPATKPGVISMQNAHSQNPETTLERPDTRSQQLTLRFIGHHIKDAQARLVDARELLRELRDGAESIEAELDIAGASFALILEKCDELKERRG